MSDSTVLSAKKERRAEARRRKVSFIPQPVALCAYCTKPAHKSSRSDEKIVIYVATESDV